MRSLSLRCQRCAGGRRFLHDGRPASREARQQRVAIIGRKYRRQRYATWSSMVSRKSSPGFVSGTARFKLAEYSRPAFTRAVKQLPNPFAPSSELLKALDDLQGEVTFFESAGQQVCWRPTTSEARRTAIQRYFFRCAAAGPISCRRRSMGKRCRRFMRSDALVRIGGWPARHHRRQSGFRAEPCLDPDADAMGQRQMAEPCTASFSLRSAFRCRENPERLAEPRQLGSQ